MGRSSIRLQYCKEFYRAYNHISAGTCVLLNSGEKAIVVDDVNKKYPNRPIIRILVDGEGQIPLRPVEIWI